MNDRLENLCALAFGKKFEVFKALCLRADENNFIFVKIDELAKELDLSKPTIINAFKFLEEKRLFKKLKNGLYELNIKQKSLNKY